MTSRLITLAVVVGVTATFLPALFGDPPNADGGGGDTWRRFIYDFQTLITGYAAIAAAFWTVAQMRTSDALQERRHQQLLELTIRPERKTALRTRSWLVPKFSHFRGRYAEAAHLMTKGQDSAWSQEEAGKVLTAFIAAKQVTAALASERMKDVQEQFPDKLSVQLDSMQLWCAMFDFHVRASITDLMALIAARAGSGDWYNPNCAGFLGAIAGCSETLESLIDSWVEEFENAT